MYCNSLKKNLISPFKNKSLSFWFMPCNIIPKLHWPTRGQNFIISGKRQAAEKNPVRINRIYMPMIVKHRAKDSFSPHLILLSKVSEWSAISCLTKNKDNLGNVMNSMAILFESNCFKTRVWGIIIIIIRECDWFKC